MLHKKNHTIKEDQKKNTREKEPREEKRKQAFRIDWPPKMSSIDLVDCRKPIRN